MVSFASFQRPLPNLSSSDRLLLFEVLPTQVQDEMWKRLAVQTADQRYADGIGPFVPTRPKRRRTPARAILPSDKWRRGTEALASIPAETYLAVLDPDTEPNRGICRCPLPDHEDRHPSASYRQAVWYCHRCGQGGGIFEVASALSGLRTRGEDFVELRRWVAERLVGQVAA